MATTLYINADVQAGPARATVLGCGWMPAVPPQYAGYVSSLPAVVLAGGGLIVIVSDSPPTTNAAVATALAPILSAEAIIAASQATLAANNATITANILTRQAQIQAWLTANPSGAVLTAAQTLTLAQMLNGLCKLMLQQYSSTTGT